MGSIAYFRPQGKERESEVFEESGCFFGILVGDFLLLEVKIDSTLKVCYNTFSVLWYVHSFETSFLDVIFGL